jgi:ATP-dependent DNA helicase RecG
VKELRGVGEKRASALEAVEIRSVYDLLTYYPRRHIDRTKEATLKSAPFGEPVLLIGRVRDVRVRRLPQRRIVVEATFFDEFGSLLVTFFNQAWRERQLLGAGEMAVFGKIELFRGRPQMTNPVIDVLGDRSLRIVPVYPQSEKAGLSTSEIARFVKEAIDRTGELIDPLSDVERSRYGLIDRTSAFQKMHFPATMEDVFHARKRLAFDELLRLQTVLVGRKLQFQRVARGIAHETAPFHGSKGELVRSFLTQLPYKLTAAQENAVREIAIDMATPHPMHRLLQGDVGSGKTLVALLAMLFAVQGGHQAALLAPTEVLAEQHYVGLSHLLRDSESASGGAYSLFSGQRRSLRVEILTGKMPVARRRSVLEGLHQGEIDLVVGTHALLSEGVEFSSLGLAVVDEQHRFGVEQRSLLRERARERSGLDPDLLVMTATPIPRTAAMTVYGDLDLSVLDQLPPGRTPIRTRWCRDSQEVADAFSHVRQEVSVGHQAYVVCPLVEESEKVEVRSAVAEFERLSREELGGLRLGLMHGQLPSAEKERAMEAFRLRELDVLVSTTVIEVGVDVPNATVMVIEDADRFGIAQLHQLRGRVGRSSVSSYCYLLSQDPTPEAHERLSAMVESADGFHLAERDLALRGEGTILGGRQRGQNDLKLASLVTDLPLIQRAREQAEHIVQSSFQGLPLALFREEVETFLEGDDLEFLFRG